MGTKREKHTEPLKIDQINSAADIKDKVMKDEISSNFLSVEYKNIYEDDNI
ncbi:MAG: hypothetical protein ACR2IS_05625 [Nitrososphaeraceae archaeon]